MVSLMLVCALATMKWWYSTGIFESCSSPCAWKCFAIVGHLTSDS